VTAPDDNASYAILWRALVQATPDIVLLSDTEGTVTFFNRAGPIHSGDPIVGSKMSRFASEGGESRISEVLKRAVEGRETVRYEVSGYRAHGRIGWHEVCAMPVVADGQVTSVLWIVADITERRQAQENLAFQAELLAEVNEPVVATDRERRVSYWNKAAERLYGWTQTEALGQPSEELFKPTWLGPATREDMFASLRETGAWVGDLTHVTKSGETVTVVTSLRVRSDARGQRSGGIAVMQDVTARRRLEEQLRQSQKMEAIGLLAGGIAHDFNNLLAIITGYSEFAASRLGRDHPVAEDLDEIAAASRRGADLTRKLLAFSRKQILQPKSLDVGAAIDDFSRMLTRVLGADIELVVERPAEPVVARADAIQLEQVLLNLCTNARQAMPEGGRLRLCARPAQFDTAALARRPWAKAGMFVEIEVSDTGVGMDERTQARMFEPFFTTKSDGTGLGLATVYGIVQQHSGFVSVESTPGSGTTFRLYLPRTVDAPATPTDGRAPLADVRGHESILIAEDETSLRVLLTTTLSELGYAVVAARDGEEAVRAYEARCRDLALVVLDVVMPRLDARGAYEKMRAIRPDVKVLFMTGYAPESTRLAELLAGGRTKVLEKPFTPQVLAAAVRRAIDDE
jgi:two-component system, cell cycle sensor histidine kinase and response regulator CckA